MSDPAVPEGLALAHTLWGEPDTSVTHAWTASGAAGVELVPAGLSGVPYYLDPPIETEPLAEPAADHAKERDPKKCLANKNTCEAWRMVGSKYCVFHRRLDLP